MKRLGKAVAEEDTDIDITPMLDVVFIMLIFFIVTASFVKEAGIGLYNPPSNDQPPPADAPKPIVVRVTNISDIVIDKRKVGKRNIKALITRMKAESPESSIIVKVCPKAKTHAVVAAIDGVNGAGITNPSVSVDDKDC